MVKQQSILKYLPKKKKMRIFKNKVIKENDYFTNKR